MKTVLGMTYAQLHSAGTDELNELVVQNIMRNVRSNFAKNGTDQGFTDAYCAKLLPKLQEYYQTKMGHEMYNLQRMLYDTEEKFNVAADVEKKLSDATFEIGKMTATITMEMMDTDMKVLRKKK